MKLNEKFAEIITCTEIEGCSKQSDDCEKIANDIAIEVAKWLVTEETEELIFDRMQEDIENTYEELLEIFKKEKGL